MHLTKSFVLFILLSSITHFACRDRNNVPSSTAYAAEGKTKGAGDDRTIAYFRCEDSSDPVPYMVYIQERLITADKDLGKDAHGIDSVVEGKSIKTIAFAHGAEHASVTYSPAVESQYGGIKKLVDSPIQELVNIYLVRHFNIDTLQFEEAVFLYPWASRSARLVGTLEGKKEDRTCIKQES